MPATGAYRTLVVGYDGSAGSRRALARARELAIDLGSVAQRVVEAECLTRAGLDRPGLDKRRRSLQQADDRRHRAVHRQEGILAECE